jgi:hypothetical protein
VTVEISDAAVEVLRRSLEAARRLNPDVIIRLVRDASGVRTVLAESAEPTDTFVERGLAIVAVEAGIEGALDVEAPHDHLVLRTQASR